MTPADVTAASELAVATAPGLVGALETAVQRSSEAVSLRVRLAGCVVDIRATHPDLLAALSPAIVHRAHTGRGPVDLTVWVADQPSTGLDPAEVAGGWAPHRPRRDHDATSLRTAFEPDDGRLTVLDAERATAYLWYPDLAAVPPWERAAPLRTVLHWWLPRHGARLIHAAAVAHADRAALLVGPGGAGKSTTALACQASGMDYLGDDYVAVSLAGAAARVHNLYASGKLVTDGGTPFQPPASWTALTDVDDRGKRVFVLDGGIATASVPIAVILVPRLGVDGVEPGLQPTSRAATLRALAPSTVLQQPGDQHDALRFARELVTHPPVRELWLHRDPRVAADHVAAALEESAA